MNHSSIIEVYKTNVTSHKVALHIIAVLQGNFPTLKINFDLEDCDRILRIESCTGILNVERLQKIFDHLEVEVEVLPD